MHQANFKCVGLRHVELHKKYVFHSIVPALSSPDISGNAANSTIFIYCAGADWIRLVGQTDTSRVWVVTSTRPAFLIVICGDSITISWRCQRLQVLVRCAVCVFGSSYTLTAGSGSTSIRPSACSTLGTISITIYRTWLSHKWLCQQNWNYQRVFMPATWCVHKSNYISVIRTKIKTTVIAGMVIMLMFTVCSVFGSWFLIDRCWCDRSEVDCCTYRASLNKLLL